MILLAFPLLVALGDHSGTSLATSGPHNGTAFSKLRQTSPPDPANGICDGGVRQLHGYLDGEGNVKLFYWFFESRTNPTTSPTLVYFQGGPGASSMLSAVSGNGGPCILNEDGTSTSVNQYSWNTFANVMYIDQPASVGFSKGTPPTNSMEAGKSTAKVLEAFFSAHPEYNTEVFLAGQSFAGHYVPAILVELMNQKSKINVEGIALGNPFIAPDFHYGNDPDMAFKSGTAPSVVSEATYNKMKAGLKTCLPLVATCNKNPQGHASCLTAYSTCTQLLVDPIVAAGRDEFDLRRSCRPSECYDYSSFEKYFNTPDVQQYLGVSAKWTVTNLAVNHGFLTDIARRYNSLLIPALNAGKRVFVFAGDQDYSANWIGNRAWLLNLKWDGLAGYKSAKTMPFELPGGEQVGKLKTFTLRPGGGQLSFLQVYAAGHSAARDSPASVQKAMSDFVGNKLR
ncbi:hypothetical protein FOL47_006763 [Perkinsus chesapeaki]|uniref:Uncharacterized protein n=1 Tax=Perkinsus chesapeaki TaxID=330153 RepID=A0A7J6LPL3_PERCH|nr:hypothetical protein FOL47_006763 [Perkinsus chesapeaki]